MALKLWVLDVPAVDLAGPELSVLDADEFQRADALEEPSRRSAYLLAHVALRQFLGEYLDLAPERVEYCRESCPECGSPRGRPTVCGPPRPVHFSLSTRGAVVLIGIASRPVGVDVEALPRRDTISRVSRLLHPSERAEVLAAGPSDQGMVFTRLWTRKEAYLKGVGVGVSHGLATEYLGVEDATPAPVGWTVLDVPVPPSYAAAVALRTDAELPR